MIRFLVCLQVFRPSPVISTVRQTEKLPHMFTFGREREKECAAHYLRSPAQLVLIQDVVDAVHDVLEGNCAIDDVRTVFATAFCGGGSGVWEQTASWLTKLSGENPDLLAEWCVYAANPKAAVRFRVACCLTDMPVSLATDIGNTLVADRSKKVREMAAARLEEIAGKPSDEPKSR